MDGVHDLGGMHGFGQVVREKNEPAFHAAWEAAVVAISRTVREQGLVNIDEFRHAIERMDPARYLSVSYYEKWLDGMSRLLAEKGVISNEALDSRTEHFLSHPRQTAKAYIARTKARVAVVVVPPPSTTGVVRPELRPPRFSAGETVITRESRPAGHTRLPRYARGKRGTVSRYHGVHVFPDTNAHGLGEMPQALYSVRFDPQELWGDSAEDHHAVYLDLWESYLLPVRRPK